MVFAVPLLHPGGMDRDKATHCPALSLALRLRELCEQYGISNRMLRPLITGDERMSNKLLAEALANRCYYMELDGEAKRPV